uniref:L51_S25_CI-B8 domain-containing protein n=1 Tax=Rhabditophanes sp. KR3021 TaxID=114890 RepID=A0AC35UE11_9BILA
MPFMHGSMPLRRTYWYLQQGKVILRDDVAVLSLGFHKKPSVAQKGARDFIFWHWAQLQYKNPTVQLVKHADLTITPFAQAFLKDGRKVLFDLENKNAVEIESLLTHTLGKTELVMQREYLEAMQHHNPASFGSECDRQCMCEIQGQQPCTSIVTSPEYLRGKWRWNHNNV